MTNIDGNLIAIITITIIERCLPTLSHKKDDGKTIIFYTIFYESRFNIGKPNFSRDS